MICRKRSCPVVSGESGFIRPSIICAPAFQAVPWLGKAACSPVVLYTSSLASEHATKRYRVQKTSSNDFGEPNCDHATKASELPTDGSAATDKTQKAAVTKNPQSNVASTSMVQMHSWGHRHRGMPCEGPHSGRAPSRQLVGYQESWLEVSHDMLAFWEKAPFKPCSNLKSVLYYTLCPHHLERETALLMKAISSTYEAFKLGKHKHGGLLLDQSIFPYCVLDDGADLGSDAWLGPLAAACARLRESAPAATDDARYMGTAAEPCKPVPLIIYLVCPSTTPRGISKCQAQVSELLLTNTQPSRQFKTASFAEHVKASSAPSVLVKAACEQLVACSQEADQSSPAGCVEADLQANYKVFVERKGAVTEQKRLGDVHIQVITQEMLMDITGEAARHLALSTYNCLLQASLKQDRH